MTVFNATLKNTARLYQILYMHVRKKFLKFQSILSFLFVLATLPQSTQTTKTTMSTERTGKEE